MLVHKPCNEIHGTLSVQTNARPSTPSQARQVITNDTTTQPRTEPRARNVFTGVKRPNDKSSATRRTGRNDCNRDAPAGFAAAYGLAHWTFTQRTIEAPLPPQNQRLWRHNVLKSEVETIGRVIVAGRKQIGLT